MPYLVAIETRLYPHFRTGDFAFLPEASGATRYQRSLRRAFADHRVPFARALLVGPGASWRDLLKTARRMTWDKTLLTPPGPRDVEELIAFEQSVREQGDAGLVIKLPPESFRRRFTTMKALSDAVYGARSGYRAWWLV